MHAIRSPRESPPGAVAGGRERTCLVTRESADPGALVRFVISPAGEVVPDVDARLPGRGFWLKASEDIVQAACARHAFARAARRPVSVPPDLAMRVAALLAKRCLDAIGLARRAGQACAGFEKVRAALGRGNVAVLLVAADAAPGSAGKLGPMPSGVVEVRLLYGAELGQVFGRERIVHAAIAPGGVAERLIRDSRRLAGFRVGPAGGEVELT